MTRWFKSCPEIKGFVTCRDPILALFAVTFCYLTITRVDDGKAAWSPEVVVADSFYGRIMIDSDDTKWTFITSGIHADCTGACVTYTTWNGINWNVPQRLDATVSTANYDSLLGDVTLNENGYPAAFWGEYDFFVPHSQSSWRTWSGGSWGPVSVIFDPRKGGQRASVDSLGRVWLLYYDSGGTNNPRVQMWNGATWTLQGGDLITGCDWLGHDIIVDGSDTPLVVFSCRAAPTEMDLYYTTWNGSSWLAPALLTPSDGLEDWLGWESGPGALALDGAGQPVVVWRAEVSGLVTDIKWSRWNGSVWSSELPINNPDGEFHHTPYISQDSAGGFGVTWTRSDTSIPGDQEVLYRHWNGASWGAIEVVSVPDGGTDTISSLAFDSSNVPWIVWWDSDINKLVSSYWFPDPTHTPTPTISSTLTVSNTPTVSETLTPSTTQTPTFSNSATWTQTHTPTHTPTHSSTWTVTGTPTVTPSFTTTLSDTNTPTISPTWTPTPTASSTFTWSGTITYSGTITPTNTQTLTFTPTPTYEDDAFFLDRNAFNPGEGEKVNIIAAAAVGGRYNLNVYNSAGELVRHLVKKDISQTGIVRSDWDGTNDQGVVVASGVYLIHVEAPKFARVRRIAVIR